MSYSHQFPVLVNIVEMEIDRYEYVNIGKITKIYILRDFISKLLYGQ